MESNNIDDYKKEIEKKIQYLVKNNKKKNKLLYTLRNFKTKKDIKLWIVRNNLNLNE